MLKLRQQAMSKRVSNVQFREAVQVGSHVVMSLSCNPTANRPSYHMILSEHGVTVETPDRTILIPLSMCKQIDLIDEPREQQTK